MKEALLIVSALITAVFSGCAHAPGFDRRPAFAGDDRLAGIAVVSDFHLYDASYDFETISDPAKRASERTKAAKNAAAYRKMLESIAARSGVTSVIMNGDLLHAPTLGALSETDRIDHMIAVLLDMDRALRRPILFNLGNHDLAMKSVGKDLVPVPGFAEKFRDALDRAIEREFRAKGRRPSIRLIGRDDPRFGDYRAVFEIEVDGRKIRVSHAPFVSTDAIEEQARLFEESSPRAFDKVAHAPRLRENAEGVLFIQSDSHSPAADAKLGVYNTGMLTVDESMPFTEPTFLVIHGETAQHYSAGRESADVLTAFEIPNCKSLLFP